MHLNAFIDVGLVHLEVQIVLHAWILIGVYPIIVCVKMVIMMMVVILRYCNVIIDVLLVSLIVQIVLLVMMSREM